MGWFSGLICYLLGGFTFLPLVLWITQKYLSISQATLPIVSTAAQEVDVTTSYNYGSKKGWVRLSSNYQPKSADIGKKKPRAKQNGEGYGVYKQGVLKVYTNELQQHCEWSIDMNDYNVSIYPPGRKEHTLFSRSVALLLERKQPLTKTSYDNNTPSHSIQDNTIYFSCPRPIDKEDWYFAFISASSSSSPTYRRAIPFDPMAMASLVSTIGKQKYEEEEQQQSNIPQQIPWFNAILGRTFLAIYKTRRFQDYVFDTLAKKTKKMKAPGFLGDIQVKKVDLGDSVPYFTQPRIVNINPDGTLVIDAQLDYKGGFNVTVEANAGGGPFSIRVPLILSLTLKSLSGTIRFKVKPPPSNRYWFGFCTMPTMKWSIVPAVSNYNVKISMVTNIIESKIKKLMTDNVVLPNMSDIPFSISNGLGGLFVETDDDLLLLQQQQQQKIDEKKIINDELMDSTMQRSFVINNQDNQDNTSASSESIRSITQSTSSSTSTSKWSKLFGSRRRKNTNTNQSTKMDYNLDGDMYIPNEENSEDGEKEKNKSSTIIKSTIENNNNNNSNNKNNTASNAINCDSVLENSKKQNLITTIQQDLDESLIKDELENNKVINIGSSIDSNMNDGSDDLETATNQNDKNENKNFTSHTSISATSLNAYRSNSTSTVSTTETTQSLDNNNDDISKEIRKDDDNISISSTTSKRKRLYNAAGFLFSKGKGLANDFKENQIKRQQSLLQYSGKIDDMRRRSKENILRRSSISSVPPASISSTNTSDILSSSPPPQSSSSSTTTNNRNITDSSLSSLSASLPPYHLIYDDISPPSQHHSSSSQLHNNDVLKPKIQSIEEKPELPSRPSLPPRPQHTSDNDNKNNNINPSLPPPLPVRHIENDHKNIVDSALMYEQLPI